MDSEITMSRCQRRQQVTAWSGGGVQRKVVRENKKKNVGKERSRKEEKH